MCNVQRVTNSCRHINDHVLMTCHAANKAVAQQAANPRAPAKDNESDVIQRSGFDARTNPYCKAKAPKDLKLPKGFQCMVPGCGRAD